MLISVPVFTTSTYLDENTSYDIGLRIMQGYNQTDDGFNLLFKSFIER